MIKLYESNCGLRIGLEKVETVKTVSIGVWVKTGSRWECPEENGIAHLIEHMLFKGTRRRSALAIMEEIEEKGGSLNAFTSREYTCFYGKVLVEDQDMLLDILSDMTYYSTMTAENLDKEKMVVLEEIAMYEDTPDDSVHDLLLSQMFPGHPLGRNILGSTQSIERMGQEQVRKYHDRYYRSDNIVVSVAGNVDVDATIRSIESVFGDNKGKLERSFEPVSLASGGLAYQTKKIEQTNICMGVSSARKEDPEYYPLVILNNILGGSGSSRLFQEIREKRGLAYSVYSYNQSFWDAGVLSIYAGTSHKNAMEVMQIIFSMLRDLRDHGVEKSEYERTKNQIRAHIIMGNESVSSRMKRIGANLVERNRIVEEEEILANLEKVTLDDVQGLAAQLLDPANYAMAIIGSEENKKPIETWFENQKGR
jgi:predicted Zn-dependent peptidase